MCIRDRPGGFRIPGGGESGGWHGPVYQVRPFAYCPLEIRTDGQVMAADVLGLGSDVVVTKNVGAANDAGRCPQKTE